MNERPVESSRREFLSGRAVRHQIEHAGDVLADAVVEAGEHRPAPAGRDTIRLQTRAMACEWSVVMNPGPPQQVMHASDALDLVHALEAQLTVFSDDSELSRLNATAGDAPQQVETGLFELLRDCQRWSVDTSGAFDPTSGPLIQLWKRCREQGRIPTEEEIAHVLTTTGIERVGFDADQCTVQFPRRSFAFDLGGVGKGYAIDRAARHLLDEGVGSFLIHGGYSSLWASGDHAGLGGWPVGIRNPLFTQERYATILLKDQGMSTSGSNIQYFRFEGQRYGHILDPRTGWPAAGLLSVTVLAPTASEADALSTAFYVMGLEKARDYCHNRPQIGAILIPVPRPQVGRVLEPVVCNLPEERLFPESSWHSGPSSLT